MTHVMIEHEDGIYFGLDENEYYADIALSYTGMKTLLVKGVEAYWNNSAMNPNRDVNKVEKDNMVSGKAFHAFLLEPDTFLDKYSVLPGTGRERNKIGIERYKYDDIVKAVAKIHEHPIASKMFQLGYPEVSIFWRCPRTGIRLKSRHDYLKIFTTADYKTTKEISESGIGFAISFNGYIIQGALYQEGTRAVKKAIRERKAKVFGEVSQKFIKAWLETDENSFYFIFQQNSAPWTIDVVEINNFDEGYQHATRAIEIYKKYYELFGVSEWKRLPEIRVIDPYNIPRMKY